MLDIFSRWAVHGFYEGRLMSRCSIPSPGEVPTVGNEQGEGKVGAREGLR